MMTHLRGQRMSTVHSSPQSAYSTQSAAKWHIRIRNRTGSHKSPSGWSSSSKMSQRETKTTRNIQVLPDISGGRRGERLIFDLHSSPGTAPNRISVNVPATVEQLSHLKLGKAGPNTVTHHEGRAPHEQGSSLRVFLGQAHLHHLAHKNEKLLTSAPRPQSQVDVGNTARYKASMEAVTAGWNTERASKINRSSFNTFNGEVRKQAAAEIEKHMGGGGGGGGRPGSGSGTAAATREAAQSARLPAALRKESGYEPVPKAGGVELSVPAVVPGLQLARMKATAGWSALVPNMAVKLCPAGSLVVEAEYILPAKYAAPLRQVADSMLARAPCGRLSLSLAMGDGMPMEVTTVGGIAQEGELWSLMHHADKEIAAMAFGKQLSCPELTPDILEIGYRNPILVEDELMRTDASYRDARLQVDTVFMEPTIVINPGLQYYLHPGQAAGWFTQKKPAQITTCGPRLMIQARLTLQARNGQVIYIDDPLGPDASAMAKQLIRPYAPFLNGFNGSQASQDNYLACLPSTSLVALLAPVAALGCAATGGFNGAKGRDFCKVPLQDSVTLLTFMASDYKYTMQVAKALHANKLRGADGLAAALTCAAKLCILSKGDKQLLSDIAGLIKKGCQIMAKGGGGIGAYEKAQALLELAAILSYSLDLPLDSSVLHAIFSITGPLPSACKKTGVVSEDMLITMLLYAAMEEATRSADPGLQMAVYMALERHALRDGQDKDPTARDILVKHLPAVLRQAKNKQAVGEALDDYIKAKQLDEGSAAVLMGRMQELFGDRELVNAFNGALLDEAFAALVSYNVAVASYGIAEDGGHHMEANISMIYAKMSYACHLLQIYDARGRAEQLMAAKSLDGAHKARLLAMRIGDEKLQKRATKAIAASTSDAFNRRAWLDEAAALRDAVDPRADFAKALPTILTSPGESKPDFHLLAVNGL